MTTTPVVGVADRMNGSTHTTTPAGGGDSVSHVSVYVTLSSPVSTTSRFEVLEDGRRLQFRSEDATSVLLDSSFDRVFANGSSLDDVYRESLGQFPQQFCLGYNCTILTCGVGDSSTIAHSLLQTTRLGSNEDGVDDQDQGLLPRLAASIFQQLRIQNEADSATAMEYTIRCSVVEIYRERLRDLLHEPSVVHIHKHTGSLVNCAALSCVSPEDVLQVVRRAQAVRTCSLPDDDSREESNMVVQLTLEQYNPRTDESLQSRLLVVDLSSGVESQFRGPGTLLLQQHIRDTIERQARQPSSIGMSTVNPLDPSICQLLSQSLGGNAHTSVVLHAGDTSSSLPNDSAADRVTLEALQLGFECRQIVNRPVPNVLCDRWQSTHERISSLQYQLDCFQHLTRALADECQRLRHRPGGANHLVDKKLWNFIEEIHRQTSTATGDGQRQQQHHQQQGLYFASETREEQQVRRDLMKLRSGLRRTEKERDEAVSMLKQLESDLAVVTSELRVLRDEQSQHPTVDQISAENQMLKQRNQELEHSLRTSLFRESEAVVFLRQYRKFYSRLLHQQATKGNGSVREIIRSIPGAPPDLNQLVDLDRVMVESGLLEVEEAGLDTPLKQYRPSREALLRSSELATRAEEVVNERENGTSSIRPGFGANCVPLSIVERRESGETTEARQKLFQTPSGRYIELRESLLEKEVLELSEYCSQLESQLTDERAVSTMLKEGHADAAITATELQALKQALERREKDVNAVIWKMNELHISGKTFRDQVESREPHISYLEGTLAQVERDYRQCSSDKATLESKYKDEISNLRRKASTVADPSWHVLGSSGLAPSLESRLVIPFSYGLEFEGGKGSKNSTAPSDLLLDCYFRARNVDFVDAETQTEAVEIGSMDSSSFHMCAFDSQGMPTSRGVSRAASALSPDDFLFMDEDSFNYNSGSQNVYGGLLDAYQVRQESSDAAPVAVPQSDSRPTPLRQESTPDLGSQSYTHHISSSKHGTRNNALMNRSLSLKNVVSSNHQSRLSISQRTAVNPAKLLSASSLGENDKQSSHEECDQANSVIQDQTATTHEASNAISISPPPLVASVSQPNVPSAIPRTSLRAADVHESLKSNSSHLPTQTDHSTSSFAQTSYHSEAPTSSFAAQAHPQSNASSLTSYMDKLRKKASDTQTTEEDEQSGTPEFMKIFKKIGFKKSEEVIETQGGAAVRELTRTAYGEHAVTTIRNEKGSVDLSAHHASSTTKKWVPKKKKGDDSDSDDSFTRKFFGDSRSGHVVPSAAGVSNDSDSDSDDESVEPQAQHQPSTTQNGDTQDDSDPEIENPCQTEPSSPPQAAEVAISIQDIEEDKPKTPPWKKKGAAPPPPPESMGSPWKKKPSLPGSSWKPVSMSSSSESIPSATPVTRDDSDSDSDDEKPKTPPWKKKDAAPPPPPSGPVYLSKPKNESGSSDSDDDKPNAPSWKKPASVPPNTVASAPQSTTTNDDSEESDDESDDEKGRISQARRVPVVAPARKVADDDDSSDSDASDSDNERRKAVLLKKPFNSSTHSSSIAPAKKTVSEDDDSSDEDSSDEDRSRPVAVSKASPPPPQPVSKVSRPASSDEDSSDDEKAIPKPTSVSLPPRTVSNSSDDEDDDSDSECDHVVPKKLEPTKAPAVATPKATEPSGPKQNDSSDEDDSSDDDDTKPVSSQKSPVVATKPIVPPAAKDDSSEEEDSSDEESPVPVRATLPTKPPPTVVKPSSKPLNHNSDEDDSSIDERSKPNVRFVVPPPKKVDPNEDSEDTSDEDKAQATKPQLKNPVANDKPPVIDSDDEEDSSDEEPTSLPPPAVQQPPPKPVPSVATTDSDEDDSDDEDDPPPKPAKADPPSNQVMPKAGYDDDEDDDDSEEEEDGQDDGFVMTSGKPSGFEPVRTVPDFGAQVTSSVSPAANHMGGWSDSKKEKAKFGIRNGQLVKNGAAGCDSSVVSEESGASSAAMAMNSPTKRKKNAAAVSSSLSSVLSSPAGKTKFVIRDGKLVKDDCGGGGATGLAMSSLSLSEDTNSGSVEKKPLKMEPSSPRKKGGNNKTAVASALFVIKDGKLVKSPSVAAVVSPAASSVKAPSPTKAPAFSIVNGKLVKTNTEALGTPTSSPTKTKKSDKKDKKEKEKKKSKKKKEKS